MKEEELIFLDVENISERSSWKKRKILFQIDFLLMEEKKKFLQQS
jgi:hypothetical protein